jgi:rubrerythrin
MAIHLLRDRGCPLSKQRFTWRDLSQTPYSKLDDDAFTRVRVTLMVGIEAAARRFLHAGTSMSGSARPTLAAIRRVEQFQQTLINWLSPADLSPLETTIGHEQVGVEMTAAVAQAEPDPYLAQVYRFSLLEEFDHLYRFAALMDRMEGRDANVILQSYTDILPGRPTSLEHRAPEDDLRRSYDRTSAHLSSKLHALLIAAGEHQAHDYYITVGPMFADPVARQLYAEIAAVEGQHVTQCESLPDPTETWLEKWLLHEAMEVYAYCCCVQAENNLRIKAIWERFLDYELGHLQAAAQLFEQEERRDPAEVLSERLPEPLAFSSQRDFVRKVLQSESSLRARGTEIVSLSRESAASVRERTYLNSDGSPSEAVAAGFVWTSGTELAAHCHQETSR